MANLSTIRAGLATRLATVDLRTPDDGVAPGQVTPAAGKAFAVVTVDPGTFLVRDSHQSVTMTFVVLLLVGSAMTAEGQKTLDSYLDTSSDLSVFAALEDDTIDLGGGGEYVQAVVGSGYGDITYNGVQYFGARLTVAVGAV